MNALTFANKTTVPQPSQRGTLVYVFRSDNDVIMHFSIL